MVMNRKEGIRFVDFANADRMDYMAYSKQFYDTDSVLQKVPEQNFEDAFDLILNQSPFLRGLMMKRENKNVGYAMLAFSYSVEAGGMEVWLEELYVVPEHRKNGVGQAFFDFIAAEYKTKMKRFRLEVMPNKGKLIQFYQKMGFETLDYLQMHRDIKA